MENYYSCTSLKLCMTEVCALGQWSLPVTHRSCQSLEYPASPPHAQSLTHSARIRDTLWMITQRSQPPPLALTWTHNLWCSHTCPVLSPWLSPPPSRAQALLGNGGQASPNSMLMMSLTSGLWVGQKSGSKRQRSRHSSTDSLYIYYSTCVQVPQSRFLNAQSFEG